jgi:hypothetical protein
VSTSWSTPDPRRPAAVAPAFATPYALPVAAGPSLAQDAFAGVLAAVATVLLGAPVGLLWAVVAPRTEVVLVGQDVRLLQPGSSAFIAADGVFLLAVAVAGAVGGLVAWRLGRAHGPAVVVGLTLGGLLAAYVAMVVGEQVGRAELEALVRAAQPGAIELTLRLRAQEALVGWPVGALLGYLGASLLRGR